MPSNYFRVIYLPSSTSWPGDTSRCHRDSWENFLNFSDKNSAGQLQGAPCARCEGLVQLDSSEKRCLATNRLSGDCRQFAQFSRKTNTSLYINTAVHSHYTDYCQSAGPITGLALT